MLDMNTVTTMNDADVEAYINQLDIKEEQRKLQASIERERLRAEQEKLQMDDELRQRFEDHPRVWVDSDGHLHVLPPIKVTPVRELGMPKPTSKLLRSAEYIHNAANNLIAEEMYVPVDKNPDDFFSKPIRQYVGFHRMTLDKDGKVTSAQKLETPERYTTVRWGGFVNRAKYIGSPGEVIVKTYLDLAAVSSYLVPMVLDGDMDNPNVDVVLESPMLNEYGTFDLAGYDVKVHCYKYFTNSPSTFPKELRVEKVHAFERKMKATSQHKLIHKEANRSYPFKGTIHYSVLGGGILFIPNSTKNKWRVRPVNRDGYPKDEYFAPRECLYPFAALVKRYTQNIPELRELVAQQEKQAQLDGMLAAYCF